MLRVIRSEQRHCRSSDKFGNAAGAELGELRDLIERVRVPALKLDQCIGHQGVSASMNVQLSGPSALSVCTSRLIQSD
jgi:hypothetical protein